MSTNMSSPSDLDMHQNIGSETFGSGCTGYPSIFEMPLAQGNNGLFDCPLPLQDLPAIYHESPSSSQTHLIQQHLAPWPPQVWHTLTTAEYEELYRIAMPGGQEGQSQNAPECNGKRKLRASQCLEVPDHSWAGQSALEPEDGDNIDDDEKDAENCDEHDVISCYRKKRLHHRTEKRYRMKLNETIIMLRDSVPTLRAVVHHDQDQGMMQPKKEDLQGLKPPCKLNKRIIFAKATEYIRHLETKHIHLYREIAALKARIGAFEKLFQSGAVGFNHIGKSI